MNSYIVEQLLTNQYFFVGSTQQFVADMNTVLNLFKWFDVHKNFKQLEECCTILQMSNEKLLEIKGSTFNKESLLFNYNISKLTTSQLETLVNKITTPKLN